MSHDIVTTPYANRTIVLIGMPGAGKSTIGHKLAAKLGIPFADADREIEAAAGMTVTEIFAQLGEPAFREGERRVIARLLAGNRMVLATGGGAFMNETTRALIKQQGLSIWLKADLDVLLERTSRTNDRPLLAKGDPRAILIDLMLKREPLYALADLTVQSEERPIDVIADRVIQAINDYCQT